MRTVSSRRDNLSPKCAIESLPEDTERAYEVSDRVVRAHNFRFFAPCIDRRVYRMLGGCREAGRMRCLQRP